jgi:hypothetical protein
VRLSNRLYGNDRMIVSHAHCGSNALVSLRFILPAFFMFTLPVLIKTESMFGMLLPLSCSRMVIMKVHSLSSVGSGQFDVCQHKWIGSIRSGHVLRPGSKYFKKGIARNNFIQEPPLTAVGAALPVFRCNARSISHGAALPVFRRTACPGPADKNCRRTGGDLTRTGGRTPRIEVSPTAFRQQHEIQETSRTARETSPTMFLPVSLISFF